jgi:hypothetical protein
MFKGFVMQSDGKFKEGKVLTHDNHSKIILLWTIAAP